MFVFLCEIWYNRSMANKNTSKTRRRPSKAELERKEAIQRMLISLGIALLLIFRSLQIRGCRYHSLQFNSLAGGEPSLSGNICPLDLSLLFQVDTKTGRPPIWLFIIFAGLLLIFEAYLVWKYSLDKSVLKGTMAQVVTDLTGFRTTSFAGGGPDWSWPLYANRLSLF